MATPKQPGKAARTAKPPLQRAEDIFAGRYPPRPDAGPPETVDPAWLLKAAALAVGGALLCAYATLCLLVYQGQWQLLLHPVAAPALNSAPFEQTVRFGASETGQPQLAGMWVAAADAGAARATILYLPDGSGNLAQDTEALAKLHTLPVNLFAFDYRGFGASAPPPPHPSEARMRDDVESAFDYLVDTRHVPASSIVPYGVGLGADLAAVLARRHAEIPAVILESPLPGAAAAALNDSRARIVPLRLFQHERFDVAAALSGLKTPKLLLESGPSYAPDPAAMRGFNGLAKAAPAPSFAIHLGNGSPDLSGGNDEWRAGILRFLDEYLHSPPSSLGS